MADPPRVPPRNASISIHPQPGVPTPPPRISPRRTSDITSLRGAPIPVRRDTAPILGVHNPPNSIPPMLPPKQKTTPTHVPRPPSQRPPSVPTHTPPVPPGETYILASSLQRPTMPPPSSNLDSVIPEQPQKLLSECEWYWGNVPKEEVTEIMKDMQDGAFLVRDAARVAGHYTLTLRKGGVNRLIRIIHRDGRYGFAEPLEYHSVVELINYYQTHSLAPYSPKLDICLTTPVSRFEMQIEQEITVDTLLENLKSLQEELREKNQKYNEMKQRFETSNEEIQQLRQEIEAQDEIIAIMGEALKEHERRHEGCPAMEKQQLKQNFDLLRRRFHQQRDNKDAMQHKLRRLEMTKNKLDTELNSLKPQIKTLQAEKANKLRFLKQRGWHNSDVDNQIHSMEEENPEEDLYATYAMLHTYRKEADYQRISEQIKKRKPPPPIPPNYPPHNRSNLPPRSLPRPPTEWEMRQRADTLMPGSYPPPGATDDYDGHVITLNELTDISRSMPHFDQSTWIRPTVTRESSKDILTGKRNGTFLVRPKTDKKPNNGGPIHSHTIDIMDGGKFKRIPVFQGPNGGFGFAAPFEFDTLQTLILYYASHTMEKHNPELETTLSYPAFAETSPHYP